MNDDLTHARAENRERERERERERISPFRDTIILVCKSKMTRIVFFQANDIPQICYSDLKKSFTSYHQAKIFPETIRLYAAFPVIVYINMSCCNEQINFKSPGMLKQCYW
jgi:hypothetical protein